jgi:hypothetical protein
MKNTPGSESYLTLNLIERDAWDIVANFMAIIFS